MIDTRGVTAGTITAVYSGTEAGSLTSSTGGTVLFSEIKGLMTGVGTDTINAALNTANSSYSTGDGADSITGGSGSEVITAGAGNETDFGGAGNDTIYGGARNNVIDGGDGNDWIIGTADDSISAPNGADASTLRGGRATIPFMGVWGPTSSTVGRITTCFRALAVTTH